MAFKGAAGYGDMYTYTGGNARADGFEPKHLAGSIMRQAISQLVFTRPLNQSTDAFGLGKGGTFTVPIFPDWGAPGTVSPLTSGTAIGIGTQVTDSVSFVMNEYGTGVGYETMGDWITNLDVRGQLVKTLGNHIGRMINWLDYDLAANSKFTIEIPTTGSVSNLQGTNRKGVGWNTGTWGELGMGAIALAYDSFRASRATPVTDRGMYVAIGNARTFRNLKQGSVFQNLSLYTDFQGLKYQVLGEFMNFVFIETEELTGNGTTFCYAANAGGYGFGKLPSVTYYPDFGQDAGRLAVWKILFYRGQGPIWRDKGTASVIIKSNTGAFSYGALG